MRKLSIALGICVFLVAFASAFIFGTNDKKIIENKKSLAEVEKVEGIYLFYRCKPLNEYTYLNTYKMPILVWSDKPNALIKKFIKESRKLYPECEGIIIDNDFSQCVIFKF